MTARLLAAASAQGQVFTRSQALDEGCSDQEIRRLVRRGHWERVRRGVYTAGDVWRGSDAAGRHRLEVHATRLTCGDDLVISHVSAAVMYGWNVWGIDLREVTVTRSSNHHARMDAGVRHFVSAMAPDEVIDRGGVRLTSPERTMVDLARRYPFEQAVVLCDQALADGASRSRARELFLGQSEWPGARNALRAIDVADARSESVGESRLRALVHQLGFPSPTPQVPIRRGDGQVVGRVDLLFDAERTVVEFDGRSKYGLGADGSDPGEVLFREKQREDAIRELGWEVVRVTWADLDSPDRLHARLVAAFVRANQRRRPSA